MNKKRIFGLGLLIASILFSFSNLTLTGNVIGYSASSYISWLAVLSFILGVVMFLMAGTENLEKKVRHLHNLKSKERRKIYFEIAHYMAKRPLTGEGELGGGAFGHRYMPVKKIIRNKQIKGTMKKVGGEVRTDILIEALEKLINKGELNYSGPLNDTEHGSVAINLSSANKIIKAYEDYSHRDIELKSLYRQFLDYIKKLIGEE